MQFSDLLAHFQNVTEEPDSGYLALCPAHTDSRPSLRIWRGDDDKVRVHCRSGCATADVLRAARLLWSDLFNSAGPGNTVPAERPTLVQGDHMSTLGAYAAGASTYLRGDSHWAQRGREYAFARFGVTADLAEELGIGVHDSAWRGGFEQLSRAYLAYPRLTVPLRNFAGQVHGLQGRDLTGKCPARWVALMNPPGLRWGQYGVFRGSGGYGVTLVCEGPGDALTAASVGYDAVAVRGAALAASDELITELAEGLRGTQVIVVGDNDTAGRSFARRLTEGLAAEHTSRSARCPDPAPSISVFQLEVPQEGWDLTDWREHNAEAFPSLLHAAVKAAMPVRKAAEEERRAVSADLSHRTGADIVSRDQGHEAARILAGLLDRYGDTDAMNAHALVAWTDGRIKYAKGLGFYVWNDRVWEPSDVKVRQEIHRMGAALVLAGKTREARGFTMTTRINDLMTELRSVPTVHVAPSDFDNAPDLLSFRNGTVDLRTGKMRPHDPADMLTYCLDIEYDPNARAPRWEQFMHEIFPGAPEMVSYMQRLLGYGVTGNVSEQCFCVLWGKGANGKSVLTDTMTRVFRAISKTTPFATFEDKGNSGGIPNDLAALRAARLVMASEGESGKPMSEGVLKRVTGKDMIAARFLRKEFFEFKPTFLLLLATNHKPKFRGQDEGLWRRVKMIPFLRYFAEDERDYELDAKLAAEEKGIAAWVVRGAMEWYANGLRDPQTITSSSREYRETSDALAGFFPGTLVRDDAHIMNGSDAFNTYLEWTEAENLPAKERWTRRAFYDAMEERGITRKKTERGVGLMGVRLAEERPQGTGIFAK